MKNAGMPAMPTEVVEYDRDGNLTTRAYAGLTKREYFAASALQGLLASWGQHDVTSPDELAYDAIIHADATLARLEDSDD